jgi:hypothetical protein
MGCAAGGYAGLPRSDRGYPVMALPCGPCVARLPGTLDERPRAMLT